MLFQDTSFVFKNNTFFIKLAYCSLLITVYNSQLIDIVSDARAIFFIHDVSLLFIIIGFLSARCCSPRLLKNCRRVCRNIPNITYFAKANKNLADDNSRC